MNLLSIESQHRAHKEADGFILAILSHGLKGVVMGRDGEWVKIKLIKTCFDGRFCPNLAGKPKLIIIQACQGGNYVA